MTLPPPVPPAAGWFPDPWALGHLRYWDGRDWTPYVHTAAPGEHQVVFPLRVGLIGLLVLLGGFIASLAISVVLYLLGAGDVLLLVGSVVGLYGTLLWYCRAVSRRYGTDDLGHDLGLQFRWIDLAIGLGCWFAAVVTQIVVSLVLQALGLPLGSNTEDITDSTTDPMLFVALAVTAILVAPVVEELFFRGLLLRSFKSRLVPWLAGVVQGLIFGAIHVQVGLGVANLTLISALAGVGIVFGFFADRVGRLGPVIVAHGILNTIAVLVAWAAAS